MGSHGRTAKAKKDGRAKTPTLKNPTPPVPIHLRVQQQARITQQMNLDASKVATASIQPAGPRPKGAVDIEKENDRMVKLPPNPRQLEDARKMVANAIERKKVRAKDARQKKKEHRSHKANKR